MFQNEDEFQAYFIHEFGRTYLGDWLFAKVTKIAGEYIQPDIDLLDVDPMRPNPTISAFEFKVLNSPNMGSNYKLIYAGIGQAISYFNYGIDKSFLVVGISDNILGEDSRNLRGKIRLFEGTVPQIHLSRFQILMYDESLNEISQIPFLPLEGRFERGNINRDLIGPIELARDNIIHGNFSKRKGRNFLRKYRLDQYLT